MKGIFTRLRSGSGGFTMIELLVVIAIIGVLAAAVIASINPIEQINKSRDTRTRSDATQLLGASERFFALREDYPWVTSATFDLDEATDGIQAATNLDGLNIAADSGNIDAILAELETSQEIKPAYQIRVSGDNQIALAKESGEDGLITTCFLPRSTTFQLEAWERCENDEYVDGSNAATLGCGADGEAAGNTGWDDELICVP